MEKFSWEKFLRRSDELVDKHIVCCKTQEEVNCFLDRVREETGKEVRSVIINEDEIEACIYISYGYLSDGIGHGYWDEFYERKGAIIYNYNEIEEFINDTKDITKETLENGMIVELRNNVKYLLLNESLLRIDNQSRYILLHSYKNNLEHHFSDIFDIMKVYKWNGYSISDLKETDHHELLWEREEEDKCQEIEFPSIYKDSDGMMYATMDIAKHKLESVSTYDKSFLATINDWGDTIRVYYHNGKYVYNSSKHTNKDLVLFKSLNDGGGVYALPYNKFIKKAIEKVK